jgi:hypothetical protein
MEAGRASCEARDAEGQEDNDRRERDDDREHAACDDGRRRRALALVCDLANVHGFVRGGTDRVASEAFVPWHVGWLLALHVTHDRV